jgi:hypothetical protein
MKKLLATIALATLLAGCTPQGNSKSIDSKVQASKTPTKVEQEILRDKEYKRTTKIFMDMIGVYWKEDFNDLNKVYAEIRNWKKAYGVLNLNENFESEGYDVQVESSKLEETNYTAQKNGEKIYFVDRQEKGIVDELDTFTLNGKLKHIDSAKNAGFQKLLTKWEEKVNHIAQERLCKYIPIITQEQIERHNLEQKTVAIETEELKQLLK